jgi:hypothetical protein
MHRRIEITRRTMNLRHTLAAGRGVSGEENSSVPGLSAIP